MRAVDQTFTIICGNCGRRHLKRAGSVHTGSIIYCPCGLRIRLEGDDLGAAARKIDREVDALRSQLTRMGFTIRRK